MIQKIPYLGPVGRELKPGMALYVEGTVPANGNQYVVFSFFLFLKKNISFLLMYRLICFICRQYWMMYVYIFFSNYRFSINFQAGNVINRDDVALTFNPRIDQYVYLNSFRNGVWEKEQLAADKPFMRGAAFNVLIVITSQGYEVCLLNCLSGI